MAISTYRLYQRSLALLAVERWLTAAVAASGIAVALVQLAEPVLFGRVVDALSHGEGAFPIIGVWAALGLFGIVASVTVASAQSCSSPASSTPYRCTCDTLSMRPARTTSPTAISFAALAGERKSTLYSAVSSHCQLSIRVLATQAPAASAMVPISPP